MGVGKRAELGYENIAFRVGLAYVDILQTTRYMKPFVANFKKHHYILWFSCKMTVQSVTFNEMTDAF